MISRLLDLGVTRAAARPGDSGVRTKFRVRVSPAEWTQTVVKLLLVDLAGCSAERHATGREPDAEASEADRHNATRRALRLVLDEHDLADDQLDDGHRIEAEKIVELLQPTAAALVAAQWPAIERVAERLAGGAVLDQVAIDALMRRPA